MIGVIMPAVFYGVARESNLNFYIGVCTTTGYDYHGDHTLILKTKAQSENSPNLDDCIILGPKHYIDNETYAYFTQHPIGSNQSCWWRKKVVFNWLGLYYYQAFYGSSIPPSVYDNSEKESFIAMLFFLSLIGTGGIILLIILCVASDLCYCLCDCLGVCCCCLCNYASIRFRKRQQKMQEVLSLRCEKCEKLFVVNKHQHEKNTKSANTHMCEQCTTLDKGVREFLDGQGSQLQNFVANEVIQVSIQ